MLSGILTGGKRIINCEADDVTDFNNININYEIKGASIIEHKDGEAS